MTGPLIDLKPNCYLVPVALCNSFFYTRKQHRKVHQQGYLMQSTFGIIGGSGLESLSLFKDSCEHTVQTVWGAPSGPLKKGTVNGVPVVIVARHGPEHTIPPTQVNYRANIQALKDAGCTHLLATSAVGSLREHMKRGDLVVPDQFIDFTKQRAMTFYERFEPHTPQHVAMADPFDAQLRERFISACRKHAHAHHTTGTVVTIEGPRFSTRAESHMFRTFGADIINMSLATETALANEAGLPYAAIAMVTDYDCWKTDEAPVSWEAILTVFRENAAKVTDLLVDCLY